MARCVPATGINRGWFRAGVSTPKSVEHRRKIGEAQRKAWRETRQRMPIGAKWVDVRGYIRVKVVEGSAPWRLEHVVVMERVIGRALSKGEVVHHINGDRQDNAESNLYLCCSASHHNAVERQLKDLFRSLLRSGVVCFGDGRYQCR
jgi:hypothetical protein